MCGNVSCFTAPTQGHESHPSSFLSLTLFILSYSVMWRFFFPFFKHLALSLSRNKIATRNVHKYLVCLESPVSVTALLGSLFHIFKVTKSLLLCLQWGLCMYSEHSLSLDSPFSSNPSNCPFSLPISSGLRQGRGRGGLGHLLL